MLRDRLVCGVLDYRLQRRLLAESNLTFSKALDLAVAVELAEKNVRDLQNTHTATQESRPSPRCSQRRKWNCLPPLWGSPYGPHM